MGFEAIEMSSRESFGLAELTRYPLFATDFLDFLRRVIPPHRHAELVFSVVVTARKPDGAREGLGAP